MSVLKDFVSSFHMVINCSGMGVSFNSPASSDTHMFISLDFALTICAPRLFSVRKICAPSVLSIDTVGTVPLAGIINEMMNMN